VASKVAEGEVLGTQLVCPCVEPERCSIALVPQDVRRCLSDEAMERYKRLSLQRLVESEEDLSACPTAGCSYIFCRDPAVRRFDCPLCEKCAVRARCARARHARTRLGAHSLARCLLLLRVLVLVHVRDVCRPSTSLLARRPLAGRPLAGPTACRAAASGTAACAASSTLRCTAT
jgi:hypothetical protein